jgi:hypothetical protein
MHTKNFLPPKIFFESERDVSERRTKAKKKEEEKEQQHR